MGRKQPGRRSWGTQGSRPQGRMEMFQLSFPLGPASNRTLQCPLPESLLAPARLVVTGKYSMFLPVWRWAVRVTGGRLSKGTTWQWAALSPCVLPVLEYSSCHGLLDSLCLSLGSPGRPRRAAQSSGRCLCSASVPAAPTCASASPKSWVCPCGWLAARSP